MPYIPSTKTPNPKGLIDNKGLAVDRKYIDEAVRSLSSIIAFNINSNYDIEKLYIFYFKLIGEDILRENPCITEVGNTILTLANAYNYEGSELGLLNYAITRIIQEVPQELVHHGKLKTEFRYYIYALTVSALVKVSNYFAQKENSKGLAGVFEDIKDEYKRRVNIAYEAHQIIKSGDCYYTPYYTKLIEVYDKKTNKFIGYQEVMVKQSKDTILRDKIGKIYIDYDE